MDSSLCGRACLLPAGQSSRGISSFCFSACGSSGGTVASVPVGPAVFIQILKMLQAGIVHQAFPADAVVFFREAFKQRIEKLLKGAEEPFDRQLVRAARAVVVPGAPPSDLLGQRVASVRAPLKHIAFQPAPVVDIQRPVPMPETVKDTVRFRLVFLHSGFSFRSDLKIAGDGGAADLVHPLADGLMHGMGLIGLK